MSSNKEAYRQKMQAELDQCRARIDMMRAQAAEAGADARIEYERQLDSLEERRRQMEAKLDELGSASGAAFEDMKKGFASAFKDLGQAVEDAAARFKR